MSQNDRVINQLFYELSTASLRFIDTMWEQFPPCKSIGRNPTDETLVVLFQRLHSAAGFMFPQGKTKTLVAVARALRRTPSDVAKEIGRDWPLPEEPKTTVSHQRTPYTASGEEMSKSATAPKHEAAKHEAKPHEVKHETKAEIAQVSDKSAETAFNTGVGKPDPKPREGKAPGGLTWVDWFKAEAAKGHDPIELQKQYVELRTHEYEGKLDVLKRHAYRHRKLALPTSGGNIKEKE